MRLPPLAERREDIVPLAEHFLASRESGSGNRESTPRLTDAARRALEAHHWPGNVRELKNAITRASLLCRDGVVGVDDLGLPAAPASAPGGASDALREPSRDEIEAALARAGGVVKYGIDVRRE